MKKVRFGLIGCGSISKKHVESIKRIRDAELACVCDIDKDAAEHLGRENSVEYYTDVHRMAKEEKIDVFTILTPSGTHTGIIEELVPYNKDFVVEKPLDVDMKRVERVIDICGKKGLKLFIVHQNRLNKPIQALRKAIERKRFGRITLATVRVRWTRKQEYYDAKAWRGTWKFDGGVLSNQADHHIDTLLWMMGDVERVSAMEDTVLVDVETPETACALLKFRNGALGIIEATNAARPNDLEGSISILGEHGSVEIGGYFMNRLKTWCFSEAEKMDRTVFEDYGSNPDIFAWNHTEYLKDVIDSISKGKSGPANEEDAKHTVKVIDAIYKSAKAGKSVFLK